jgi:alkylation response protein AidB-like acyl-CoA dehydrogenase
MGHYIPNTRDIVFNLFEVYGLDERLGDGPFAAIDGPTARGILEEVERLATGPFADGFVEGDRTPLELDEEGNVAIPAGLKRALDAYFQGEWHRPSLPEHLGGYGAPPSLGWAISQLLLGANPAALMYCAGPFFARIAADVATPEQVERWIRPWIEHQWGATMVLTEPDAGSDVGAGRAKATDNGDGTWSITGVKRFITNGDFDWPDNIVHLVLARPDLPDVDPGTKGLSLFIVPKCWYEADGTLGERNTVIVTNV